MIEIIDEQFNIHQEFFLEKLGKIAAGLSLNGTVVIKLGTKEESRELNHYYLKKDYPTDVLSFPFNEQLPDEDYYIGDIFICYPVAEEQAKENHVSINIELSTLMVHGLLHLAGYDHETDSGEMLALQNRAIESHFPSQPS